MPYVLDMYGLYARTSYIGYTLKERASSVPSPDSLTPPDHPFFFFSHEPDLPRPLERLHQL